MILRVAWMLAAAAAVVGGVAAAGSCAAAASPSPSPPPTPSTLPGWWVVNATSGARGVPLHPLQRRDSVVQGPSVSPYALQFFPPRGALRYGVELCEDRNRPCKTYAAPPYTLNGTTEGGQLRQAALLPGWYFMTARAGGVEYTASFVVNAPFPPAWAAAPDAADDLPVPTASAGCPAPLVTRVVSQTNFWFPRPWIYDLNVAACDAADRRWRLRFFTAPAANRSATPQRVLQGYVKATRGREGIDGTFYLRPNRTCIPEALWADLCSHPASAGGGAPTPAPVCVNTPWRLTSALELPVVGRSAPFLPSTLAVAPGSRLWLRVNVTASREGPYPRPTEGQPHVLRLVAIVERADGTILRGRPVTNSSVALVEQLTGGVTLADHNATVYVEYSRAECPEGRPHTPTGRTPTTRLTVSPSAPLVMQQEAVLPVIVATNYPRTRWGEPVTVTVRAFNPPDGAVSRGADGALELSALTYQWYLASTFATPFQEDPSRLEGETRSSLFLPAAKCDSTSQCGRYGCTRRTQYLVDVCSPAGCTRSDRVLPVVTAPRNATLVAELLAEGDCTDWAAEEGA